MQVSIWQWVLVIGASLVVGAAVVMMIMLSVVAYFGEEAAEQPDIDDECHEHELFI